MIRHLLKLVWHRKRANGLLIVEIFFSFLVVFAVAGFGVHLLDNYRRPLGFSWENVWDVRVEMGPSDNETWTAVQVATFERVLREVKSLDGVAAAAGAFSVPYDNSTSMGVWGVDGRDIHVELNWVTDDFAEVMGIALVGGRWFEEADSAQTWKPVIIDRELATDLFGAEDPIGRKLPFEDEGVESRVVGLVADFRKAGELSAPMGFLFHRVRVGDARDWPPRNFVLELAPGTDAEFEQELVERLQALAPGWSFEVRPLEQMRESSFRLRLAPLAAAGVVAAFLMLMVGLGLIGVLWQNVTQRTREIGLRRATGASGGAIRRQVLMELWIVTSVGVALGALVVLQLPLLELTGPLHAGALAAGLLLAAVLIYLMAALCGLYPSWLATRVQPAEALHYE